MAGQSRPLQAAVEAGFLIRIGPAKLAEKFATNPLPSRGRGGSVAANNERTLAIKKKPVAT